MRFSRLREYIGSVSQRMLTKTSRRLKRDGLVSRQVHPVIPPRVDYRLTPLGSTLRDKICGFEIGRKATCTKWKRRGDSSIIKRCAPTSRIQPARRPFSGAVQPDESVACASGEAPPGLAYSGDAAFCAPCTLCSACLRLRYQSASVLPGCRLPSRSSARVGTIRTAVAGRAGRKENPLEHRGCFP